MHWFYRKFSYWYISHSSIPDNVVKNISEGNEIFSFRLQSKAISITCFVYNRICPIYKILFPIIITINDVFVITHKHHNSAIYLIFNFF
jgi:hypothetical protein